MRLLPRQEEFFDLFTQVATRSHEAAGHLLELFSGQEDRREYHVDAIKRLEHEADEITHEVVRRLDRTFITPIDREDIHLLASDLDDVLDRIDSTARRSQIFRLGATPEGITELCELIVRITAETAIAVEKLRGKDDVIQHCIEAKRLEEEGDALYHTMLGRLFERETDAIAIIKWKEMYDNLERTIDDCADVANDLESIVLKNA
jgi:predicted phosphate transport protein (TIGR00153 family)